MKRVSLLIDGGHLRVLVRQANKNYDNNYIEKIALSCRRDDEDLFRIFYYDCAPFSGEVTLPVSGNKKSFAKPDGWINNLANRDLFALRLGVLKFRGFNPKRVPIAPDQLTDDDFEPVFEQKGVDMKIGLDIATFSDTRAVDRIILITNDTDCIPAMKYGRRAGIQIVLMGFPNKRPARDLLHHADFYRTIEAWPDQEVVIAAPP